MWDNLEDAYMSIEDWRVLPSLKDRSFSLLEGNVKNILKIVTKSQCLFCINEGGEANQISELTDFSKRKDEDGFSSKIKGNDRFSSILGGKPSFQGLMRSFAITLVTALPS